jgi:adenylate cyclase
MERKLAAILSADVKGYSRLMGEDEEATIRTLAAHREVMTTLIQQHRGRVVDAPGDNLLAEFASAVDAVRCAAEVQHELKVRNAELPDRRRMEFRLGINVGDVVVEGEKIYGDGVNIAARLEGLAEPGGICISGTVHDQVENKLALRYEYVGEQVVKNIAKPVRVWRVRVESAAAASVTKEQDAAAAPLLPLPDKPSIAVLPFTNMSGDPEQEYFSDGITEDITTDLSKIPSLFVISRNSAFTYKGKAAKVRDISCELGVRYVIEGSVRKAGERVRISAQLIDATTDRHLWAERHDRPLKDIFTLQDEITQKIVFALKVNLTPEEQERFKRSPTANLEAYDALLRGQEYLWRFTPEANVQARQMFEKALKLDPKYAAAYTNLAATYWRDWWQGKPDPRALDRAFDLAQTAIDLDDASPYAHTILAQIYVWKKQHEQAIAEGRQAIALNPNYDAAYHALGDILSHAGQPEEALKMREQAMRLNPKYPPVYLNGLGYTYFLLRRYEEAIAALKKSLSRNPNLSMAHLNLAAVYAEAGREEEARAKGAEILQSYSNFSLESVRQRSPAKDPAQTERYLTALRKAGLK